MAITTFRIHSGRAAVFFQRIDRPAAPWGESLRRCRPIRAGTKVPQKENALMMKVAMTLTAAMMLASSLFDQPGAQKRDVLARFEGAIGALPLVNVSVTPEGSVTVTRNTVRQVQPIGGPWTIADLSAQVSTDGRIRVKGSGLVFASGDNIGRTTGQRVFATLICENVAPFAQHNTNLDGVALADNGDFRIDDVLDSVPAACDSPVLLIRNAARASNGIISGAWFAAGIPRTGE
jgi:hypothetical protein